MLSVTLRKSSTFYTVEIDGRIMCKTPDLETALKYLGEHCREVARKDDPAKTDVQKAAEKGFDS